MKRKDFEKLKTRSEVELKKELADAIEKLYVAGKDAADGKLKNVRLKATIRKDIAKIKTLMQNSKTAQAAQTK
jgi:ribosomal protein L29